MGYLRKHRLLSLRRSPFWQKSRAINIVIIVVLAYFALNFVALGLFVDVILENQYPDVEPIVKFTEFFCYYLMADLLVRFLMQELPVISIAPYLHLPIKRSKIFNHLLTKSLTSFLNYFPLLIIIPFFFKEVSESFGVGGQIAWLASILILIFFNNYVTFILKKIFSIRPAVSLIILVLIGLIIYLDQNGTTAVSTYFTSLFLQIPSQPIFIVIPILMLMVAYYASFQILSRNAYLEEPGDRKSGVTREIGVLSSLGNRGTIGQLILTEIRLILRNARPRTMFITSTLLLLYGLIFYNDRYGYGFYIFAGVFVTGSVMINLGQLVFAWNSSFFDLLLTRKLSIRTYLDSKYQFYLAASVISYILTLPYGFLGLDILYINTAVVLFNIGCNSIIILWVNTNSTKRVDLGKGAFFNYEGFGASQFLLAIPILLAPIIIYAPFGFLGYQIAGIITLGVIGLCGIIFRNYLLDRVSEIMIKKKYKMASGFRSI